MKRLENNGHAGTAGGLTGPILAALTACGLAVPLSGFGAAATANDPVRAYVALGAGYEDNLFRLEGEEEAESSIGTDQLDDWYGQLSAGFDAAFAGDERRIDVSGKVYRQDFDRFGDLDHTGGHFNLDGEWSLSAGTTGTLGYGYQRRLQSFTNKDSTNQDIVDEHGVRAGVDRRLGERWQARVSGGFRDLEFSTSDNLDKQRLDGAVEVRYAASQRSIFGLLMEYTESNFDDNDGRDFSGWSIGPNLTWHVTSSTEIEANLGYTHRGLEESGELDDYDGVTGYVQGRWQPGSRFSTTLRIFRDVSNLGGEISEYTERTGVRFQPAWQLTPKLTGTLTLEYEDRDFSVVETTEIDRKDDYFRTDLGLAMAVTQRLLVSLGYGYEQRDSNVPEQEFDAHIVTAEVRLDF